MASSRPKSNAQPEKAFAHKITELFRRVRALELRPDPTGGGGGPDVDPSRLAFWAEGGLSSVADDGVSHPINPAGHLYVDDSGGDLVGNHSLPVFGGDPAVTFKGDAGGLYFVTLEIEFGTAGFGYDTVLRLDYVSADGASLVLGANGDGSKQYWTTVSGATVSLHFHALMQGDGTTMFVPSAKLHSGFAGGNVNAKFFGFRIN